MTYNILFGTYTHKKSVGIYKASLSDNGTLSNLENIIKIGSPTYFALFKNLLYTVDKRGKRGGISVWDLSQKPARKTDEKIVQGSAPAYVFIDKKRKLVYTANYHKGLINIFKINGNKIILINHFQNKGKGPKPEQESSHMHYVSLTPDQKLICVDLGTDQVLTFSINKKGELTNKKIFNTKKGFGPRHLRFNKNGKYAYLLGELSSKISVLKYKDGIFKLVSTLSTIPLTWKRHNGAAALRLSDDYKYLYVSNRGYNSIAVFKIMEKGKKISLIQQISTEGDFPRDFNLTPDGRFLIVVNQNSNNASSFAINSTNGKLSLIQKNFYIPEAVRVYFKQNS